MSTKIFNGYKTRAMSGAELLQFANMLRETMRPIGKKLYIERFAQRLSHGVAALVIKDTWPLKDKTSSGDEKRTIFDVTEDDFRMRSRDKMFGCNCNFVLFPLPDQTLIRIYHQSPEFLKAFEVLPGVEPYWYWDNTDPDKSVSEVEWDFRKETWEKVLAKDPSSLRGLIVECFVDWMDFTPYFDINKILEGIPDFDSRVNSAALNVAFWNRAKQLEVEEEIANHWFEIDQWLNTEEGLAARAAAANEVAPLLPLITRDFLATPIQELRRFHV